MNALLLLVGLIGVPLMAAKASPPAPHEIVIIACRVDDLGLDKLPDGVIATGTWKNLQWHFDKGNELECKREQMPLVDFPALMSPEIKELNPDFSDFAQCSAVAMQIGPRWEAENSGWGVIAIGCPVQITADGPDGPVIGWKLPDCPSSVGGLAIKCKFDGSAI